MNETMSRYIELDNWIFEIKSVRAIRVENYGEPYSAIGHLCINGNSVYVDGLMARDNKDLSQDDYQTFIELCQRLGLSQIKFDGFHNHDIPLKHRNCDAGRLKFDERAIKTA